MSFKTDHKQKFDELRFHLDINNKNQMKAKSNGGNCILFYFPPNEEEEYLKELLDRYSEKIELIYINKLLVEFIDNNGSWNDFEEYYADYKDSTHIIFNPDNNKDISLFKMILNNIQRISKSGKIPVIVRTGALFGTGIENVTIMENYEVLNLETPLVIFYPAKIESDNLLFLNFRQSSKYRCVLI